MMVTRNAELREEERRLDVFSTMWITYRSGFPRMEPYGYTDDSGWGCMLRSAQMLMIQALQRHMLGRCDTKISDGGPTGRFCRGRGLSTVAIMDGLLERAVVGPAWVPSGKSFWFREWGIAVLPRRAFAVVYNRMSLSACHTRRGNEEDTTTVPSSKSLLGVLRYGFGRQMWPQTGDSLVQSA